MGCETTRRYFCDICDTDVSGFGKLLTFRWGGRGDQTMDELQLCDGCHSVLSAGVRQCVSNMKTMAAPDGEGLLEDL